MTSSIEYAPLFGALEPIDLHRLAGEVTHAWWNRTLVEVDGALVRLGVFDGEFHWHHHDDEDEFFLVIEGRIRVEIEGREPVELTPGHALVVPAGTEHRPVAPVRSVVLMIERVGIDATGD